MTTEPSLPPRADHLRRIARQFRALERSAETSAVEFTVMMARKAVEFQDEYKRQKVNVPWYTFAEAQLGVKKQRVSELLRIGRSSDPQATVAEIRVADAQKHRDQRSSPGCPGPASEDVWLMMLGHYRDIPDQARWADDMSGFARYLGDKSEDHNPKFTDIARVLSSWAADVRFMAPAAFLQHRVYLAGKYAEHAAAIEIGLAHAR